MNGRQALIVAIATVGLVTVLAVASHIAQKLILGQ